MSILHECENGWFISHLAYLMNIYETDCCRLVLPHIIKLFQIFVPFVSKTEENIKRKRRKKNAFESDDSKHRQNATEEINYVRRTYEVFVNELRTAKLLDKCSKSNFCQNNDAAQEVAKIIYRSYINPNSNFNGRNDNSTCIRTNCHQNFCFFPPKCQFFNCDIREVNLELLDEAGRFHIILMDPPWWNKYIRRKKKRCAPESYEMLYNEELMKFPLNRYLDEEGLVLIWCTNAPNHISELKEKLLPAWKLEHIATWYWLKVTVSGEVICPFSEPCKKQPFERIIIASRSQELKAKFAPLDKRLILSVPSAIHSHKPPLNDILKKVLPKHSKCLELFARYLLPEWTSIGNEVLKFQCYPESNSVNEESQPSSGTVSHFKNNGDHPEADLSLKEFLFCNKIRCKIHGDHPTANLSNEDNHNIISHGLRGRIVNFL